MGRGTRCTLSRLAEDTKLNSAINMPEGWDAMQRDVEKHKKWACGNIIGFKKGKSKVLHLGQDQPQYPCRRENDGIEGSLSYLGVLVCEKFNIFNEPAACACRPESQSYPVLHQTKHVPQVKGVDSVLLLRTFETQTGVLDLTLESSPQESRGPDGMGPEEDYEDDWRDGISLL